MGFIIQLAILTAQRRQEIAGVMWCELDLKRGIWKIPGSRTKNKQDTVVPLSNLAIAILCKVIPVALPRRPGEPLRTSPYVFPAKDPTQPFKTSLSARPKFRRNQRSRTGPSTTCGEPPPPASRNGRGCESSQQNTQSRREQRDRYLLALRVLPATLRGTPGDGWQDKCSCGVSDPRSARPSFRT